MDRCKHCNWKIEEKDWRNIEQAGSRCPKSNVGHERKPKAAQTESKVDKVLCTYCYSMTPRASTCEHCGRPIR